MFTTKLFNRFPLKCLFLGGRRLMRFTSSHLPHRWGQFVLTCLIRGNNLFPLSHRWEPYVTTFLGRRNSVLLRWGVVPDAASETSILWGARGAAAFETSLTNDVLGISGSLRIFTTCFSDSHHEAILSIRQDSRNQDPARTIAKTL